VRLLIALVIWIGAVAAAVEVSTVVADSIHNPAATATQTGGGTTSPTSTAPATATIDPTAVKPTDSVSMFRTANLARALATIRSHLGARAKLEEFTIYPGYIAATAVGSASASAADIYLNVDGSYSQTSGGGGTGTPAFALSRVSATAPATLAHRIATAGRVAESQLNYFVAQVDLSDNKFRWLVYPKTGNRVEYFEAPGANGQLLEYLNNSSSGLQPVR
jgi:hypothetical protein